MHANILNLFLILQVFNLRDRLCATCALLSLKGLREPSGQHDLWFIYVAMYLVLFGLTAAKWGHFYKPALRTYSECVG